MKNRKQATNYTCFMTYMLQKGIEHALQANWKCSVKYLERN